MEDINFNWDIVVAIVAIAAFLQPWLIMIINKKTTKIEILPNKSMSLGFNKRGVYIILNTVFVSHKMEATISMVKLRILKSDKLVNTLEWDIFTNPYENWISGADIKLNQNIATYAHQVFLNPDKPELFKIQFIDQDCERKTIDHLSEGNRNQLLTQCNFEIGEYTCEFEIIGANNKSYIYSRKFVLKKEDVAYLQSSIDEILEGRIHHQLEVILGS